MFFKTGVLKKNRNIYSETPLLESLLNKGVGFQFYSFF